MSTLPISGDKPASPRVRTKRNASRPLIQPSTLSHYVAEDSTTAFVKSTDGVVPYVLPTNMHHLHSFETALMKLRKRKSLEIPIKKINLGMAVIEEKGLGLLADQMLDAFCGVLPGFIYAPYTNMALSVAASQGYEYIKDGKVTTYSAVWKHPFLENTIKAKAFLEHLQEIFKGKEFPSEVKKLHDKSIAAEISSRSMLDRLLSLHDEILPIAVTFHLDTPCCLSESGTPIKKEYCQKKALDQLLSTRAKLVKRMDDHACFHDCIGWMQEVSGGEHTGVYVDAIFFFRRSKTSPTKLFRGIQATWDKLTGGIGYVHASDIESNRFKRIPRKYIHRDSLPDVKKLYLYIHFVSFRSLHLSPDLSHLKQTRWLSNRLVPGEEPGTFVRVVRHNSLRGRRSNNVNPDILNGAPLPVDINSRINKLVKVTPPHESDRYDFDGEISHESLNYQAHQWATHKLRTEKSMLELAAQEQKRVARDRSAERHGDMIHSGITRAMPEAISTNSDATSEQDSVRKYAKNDSIDHKIANNRKTIEIDAKKSSLVRSVSDVHVEGDEDLAVGFGTKVSDRKPK